MPIYEFTCSQCYHTFEKMIPISHKETILCPECAAPDVKQLFSPFFAPGSKSASMPMSPCHQCNASCAHAKS